MHDNIVHCVEAFNHDKCVFMIIEIMAKNFTAVVHHFEESKFYTENMVKYILREVLKGLSFLHARHILHRDIKSDNVLYDLKGGIKLSDFGCATQLTKQNSRKNTMIGTNHWLAPEMIKLLLSPDAKLYGGTVDVWSFGVFCHELATG